MTLVEQWLFEEQAEFQGWDFSYLKGRMLQDETPWQYLDLAGEAMQTSRSMLDMATGGGETLLRLRSKWPLEITVTEGFEPNVILAKQRLSPLGVSVVAAEPDNDNQMPFKDGEFDLILNRHGAFNSAEVARTLTVGGTFLTQQIHGLFAHDLIRFFDASPASPNATPQTYLPLLEAAGLQVERSEEWQGELVFTDVGALVYYLHNIPWTVPGFAVASHLSYLHKLQTKLERNGQLTFTALKYLMVASKS